MPHFGAEKFLRVTKDSKAISICKSVLIILYFKLKRFELFIVYVNIYLIKIIFLNKINDIVFILINFRLFWNRIIIPKIESELMF